MVQIGPFNCLKAESRIYGIIPGMFQYTRAYSELLVDDNAHRRETMTVTKTMTASQMSWSLRRGFAWESPSNNGGLGDEFITKTHIYTWTPPTIDRDGGTVEGRFEGIE